MKKMDTAQLRENFLLPGLFVPGQANFVYTHYDRMIAGGVVPSGSPVSPANYEQLKSSFFLERREMGIINIGGPGTISADGTNYELEKLDCLYLGRGTKEIAFSSKNAAQSARFFILSAPAHATFPNTLMKCSGATPAQMGSPETCNERTIYKYIHEDGIKSCQLVMGLTILKQGSVWNTMPAHTHNRRMEAYLYFDVKEDQRVFHFMGEPGETRHLLIANEDAVVSPPWSIHSGCGTSSYSFIWGMAGENQSFADMDAIAIKDLK
jgi:4-deoxy-L-threo-5-hexosulose-uronate ketol-isomerase